MWCVTQNNQAKSNAISAITDTEPATIFDDRINVFISVEITNKFVVLKY